MPFFACKGPLSIWLGEGKCLKIFNEHLFALAMRILHIPFGTKNNKVKNLSVQPIYVLAMKLLFTEEIRLYESSSFAGFFKVVSHPFQFENTSSYSKNNWRLLLTKSRAPFFGTFSLYQQQAFKIVEWQWYGYEKVICCLRASLLLQLKETQDPPSFFGIRQVLKVALNMVKFTHMYAIKISTTTLLGHKKFMIILTTTIALR